MLDKQYSVQFFTSLVESMQKVCREYLQFDQAVELSGYLSLEIDSTKRERYVISELLHSSGNVISESYCTKAFKTLPNNHARKPSREQAVLHELNDRQQDQSGVSTAGADSAGYSKQFAVHSSDFSVIGQSHSRVSNSVPQTDVFQQEPYLDGGWESAGLLLDDGSSETARSACVSPRSPSGSRNRLTGTSVKRRNVRSEYTSEPKKGKPSSNNELSEHLQSSSVPSNIPQTSEQSASTYPTTSDSPSSGPITCNIKTEADDSLQLIQIDNAEDNSGLDSGEQFKTVPTGDSKSFSDDVQNTHGNHLHYNVGHQGVWQEEPPHQVELFKSHLFCTTCGIKCVSESDRLSHKCRIKPRDSVRCPVCVKTFFNRQSMKRHQAVHSPLKPFSCEQCMARFSSKTAMTQHLKYRHKNTEVMTMTWDLDDSHVASQIVSADERVVRQYAAVTVDMGDLMDAELRSLHSRDPPSALLNFALDLLFSPSELANSTGLGMKSRRRDSDLQRPLDAFKLDAVRDYVTLASQRQGWPVIANKDFVKKIWNKITNSRKKPGIIVSVVVD